VYGTVGRYEPVAEVSNFRCARSQRFYRRNSEEIQAAVQRDEKPFAGRSEIDAGTDWAADLPDPDATLSD